MTAAMKLCECGCGEPTVISPATSTKFGWQRGQPRRFLKGHNARLFAKGDRSPSWKGGRNVTPRGYVRVRMPDHPRAESNGYVPEHVIVAERSLGRYLVRPELVHHFDEDKTNNAPSNLVICPDDAYHALLHKRARAYRATGNANAHRCSICRGYGDQSDITVTRGRKDGDRAYHRACAAAAARRRKVAS